LNEIICGDALTVLREMPDESVQCCVTSPPYFGLRDYGCAGQVGLEPTPEEYTERLTEIFREVRRVLKPDGVCWLNVGDSYAGSGKGAWDGEKLKQLKNKQSYKFTTDNPAAQMPKKWDGIKPKDLIGIPWRVALALQADGWWLRSAVIWEKPNALPQSVKDRPTNSYEFVFLLAKSQKYYYDYQAIMEPIAAGTADRMKRGVSPNHKYINGAAGQTAHNLNKPRENRTGEDIELPAMRNKRDVWRVVTNSYRAAHFATFPVDLVRPCILAGCPPGGVVLDPFIGSGTTAVAALTEDRNYIGIELNPDFCAIARERIEKQTAL
jgi:DNA modification methylase